MKVGTTARTALVLGGAGFVGHHLVRRLSRDGWRVVVMDDLSRGRREQLGAAESANGVYFIVGDVAAPGVVHRVVETTRPALVYHLAAIHFIPQCIAAPAETVRVNVLGTQCVLDALAAFPETRLVFASTADVYAPSDAAHAEDAALAPGNVYGASKLMSERLLEFARRARRGDGRLLAARFFNVYGPGETNPHVLPDILAWLRRGETPRLGNLEPLRDYVHATDVVDALVRLAFYDGPEEVFNVGTGVASSVRDLLAGIGAALGRRIDARQDAAKVRPVERMSLIADASRARRELGWSPRVTLADGLRDLVERELASTAPVIARAASGAR